MTKLLVESQLSEDVYSLMFTANYCSKPFLIGMTAFLFQLDYALMLLNGGIFGDDVDDSINITGSAGSKQVTHAMVLMAFLPLVSVAGWNVIASAIKLKQGYHERVLETLPFATYFKWKLSCLCQIICGVVLLMTGFVRCVISSTVNDLVVNLLVSCGISLLEHMLLSSAQKGNFERKEEIRGLLDQKMLSKPVSKSFGVVFFVGIYAVLVVAYGCVRYDSMGPIQEE